jgi:hypothetical protein
MFLDRLAHVRDMLGSCYFGNGVTCVTLGAFETLHGYVHSFLMGLALPSHFYSELGPRQSKKDIKPCIALDFM